MIRLRPLVWRISRETASYSPPLDEESHQGACQAQDHALHHKGPADEAVGRTAHLHDGDLLPAIEGGQLDGVGDDEQGDHHQHGHQHNRHAGGDVAHHDEALGDLQWPPGYGPPPDLPPPETVWPHLLDILDMDLEPVPEHLAGGRLSIKSFCSRPALKSSMASALVTKVTWDTLGTASIFG